MISLRPARATGRLKTHFDPPTGGLGGPPRAIVSADGWLDPGAHVFQRPDPAWGWTGKLAYWRVPDDLPPQVVDPARAGGRISRGQHLSLTGSGIHSCVVMRQFAGPFPLPR